MDDQKFSILYDLLIDLKRNQEEMNDVTIENSVVLDEHIRRTLASEKRLAHVEDQIIPAIRDEMSPIKDHIRLVNSLIKIGLGLIGVSATLLGIATAIRSLQ